MKPTREQALVVIEEALRKSKVRMHKHFGNDILVALAEGLRAHGVDAVAVSRRCHFTSENGSMKMHSPEDVPCLLIEGEPVGLWGGQGWEGAIRDFWQTGNRKKFYADRTWQAKWQADAKPLAPGVQFSAMQEKLRPALDAALANAQACQIDAHTPAAPAPANRPRF